jgi:hypothetical protein
MTSSTLTPDRVVEPRELDLDLTTPVTVEPAARRDLRSQIARLERELCALVESAPPPSPQRNRGPHLLTLGELEATRDRLAKACAAARQTASVRAEQQQRARLLVEAMQLDPGSYRWVQVTREQTGEPGCGAWHVVPRLGLIGMLLGWWRVKISSGCPLATAAPKARGG